MSRRRLGVLLLLLLIGAGGGIWFWRARRGKPTTASAESAKPTETGKDRIAGWAADPDAPRAAIEGIVRAPDGKPFAGALVAAIPAEDDESVRRDSRLRPAGTARSGPGGRFRIENLHAGPYAATATAPGFAAAFKGELSLLPGETLSGVELQLGKDGVTLSGHVADSGGGPIGGAEIRAHRHSKDHGDLFQVLADGQGAYQVMVPKGDYTLEADAEGYAPESQYVRATIDHTIDFKLNPSATLRGKVVLRSTKEPVAGAEVSVVSGGRWWMDDRKSTTNAQGIFELKDLDPGEYELSARKGPLVGQLGKKVGVTLAGFTSDVTIELDRARVVRGHVRSADGKAIAGAKLRMGEGPWGEFTGRLRATAGSDGAYQIEGVLPGKYVLAANAAGYAPGRVENVLVADQDLDGVDVTMPPGSEVTGQVVGKDGQPVAGAAVTAFVSSGGGLWGARSWATDRSGPDGRFHLKDLGAGQLHVDADHPDRGHASLEPVALTAGEKKDVTLTIAEGGSISGTVKWDDGTPAANISVTGFSRQSGMAQTRTGADGRYTLAPLGKGQVIVSASRKDGGFFMMRGGSGEPRFVSLGANERKTGIDLTLAKGGHRITGIVVGPDGNPVEGASVSATAEIDGRSFRMKMPGMDDGKVFSAADGSFTVDDITQGQFTVYASKAGFPDAQTQHVPADASGVRLQFKAPSLVAGVVVGGSGAPIADYAISVLPAQAQTDEQRVQSFIGGNRQSVHDPSGAFEVSGLSAGLYDLVVTTSDGHAGKLGGVSLADGEQKRNLKITIQQGITLRGRVVEYGTGAPIANVHVIAGGTGQPMNVSGDAQGNYKIDGLPPGRPVNLYVSQGMPMMDPSKYLGDAFEFTVGDGKDVVDAPVIKLIQGDMSQRPDGDVGLSAHNRDGHAYVDNVRPDSPAARAGIKPGDALTAIDGKDCSDLGPVAIAFWLGGPVGSDVKVQVGGKTVTLTRVPRKATPGM